MGDFHQSGPISTLHRLGEANVERLEAQLLGFSRRRPISLVLPCLYSELQGEALDRIVEDLKEVRYIDQIVLSMDRMDRDQFQEAASYFSQLPQRLG